MHVMMIIANNSSVPYFNWFAEESLRKNDIRFSFVALYHEMPVMMEEMKKRGCECYWIKFDHQQRKKHLFGAFTGLYKLFRKIKPDIVHSHLFDDSLPTVLAGKLAGIKKIFVTKSDTSFHWYYAPKGVKFDRLINRLATNLIAISGESKKFIIEKEGARADKVTLIHHGIPVEQRLAGIKEEFKEKFISEFQLKNKFIIGTVSRLIEWKGYRYILEAAPSIIEKIPEARFVFVGRGEQKQELMEIARQKNISENVVFTGWIDPVELPSLFSLFDIYIHAAQLEPFGFVIAEAMAHSLPVVTTATGAAKDAILHKENGFLIEPKNPQQIVEGVLWVLENNKDKKLNQRAHEKAKELFDFTLMYQKHLKLYQQGRL